MHNQIYSCNFLFIEIGFTQVTTSVHTWNHVYNANLSCYLLYFCCCLCGSCSGTSKMDCESHYVCFPSFYGGFLALFLLCLFAWFVKEIIVLVFIFFFERELYKYINSILFVFRGILVCFRFFDVMTSRLD